MIDTRRVEDDMTSMMSQGHLRAVHDHVYTRIPLLHWLGKKGRKTVVFDGEKRTTETLPVTKSSDLVLPVSPSAKPHLIAEFPHKSVCGAITVNITEYLQYPTYLKMLIDNKVNKLKVAMCNTLGAMLFGDGTGNKGKDIMGLAGIVADDPTTGSLGGIDRSTNPWWRNETLEGGKLGAPFDTLLRKMTRMYDACSEGSDHPDLIICDQATYEAYEGLTPTYGRFVDADMARAGFENLKFKGAVVVFDPACPSDANHGKMYFLNSKYLSWTVDTEANFAMTLFKLYGFTHFVSKVLLIGNLITSNCAKHGVIYDIDLK